MILLPCTRGPTSLSSSQFCSPSSVQQVHFRLLQKQGTYAEQNLGFGSAMTSQYVRPASVVAACIAASSTANADMLGQSPGTVGFLSLKMICTDKMTRLWSSRSCAQRPLHQLTVVLQAYNVISAHHAPWQPLPSDFVINSISCLLCTMCSQSMIHIAACY